MEKLEKKAEILGDKEKLQQIQSFVEEMNTLGLENGERKITVGDTKLAIESVLGDAGSYVKFNLTKDGKEVFSYEMKADMFYKENGQNRPIAVTIQIDGKKISYSGDEKNEHGIYNNYNLLAKAKKYQDEIELMINKKDLKDLKKEILGK